MLTVMIHATILAFGLILPLGVQNVFIFNQGVTQVYYRKALPAVITAAICDTILISLAILGVSVIVLSFAWLKTTLMLVGIIFLLYMGFVIWKSTSSVDGTARVMTVKNQVVFTLSISLLNPHALLDTVGVIGTSSLQYEGSEKLVFGVVCIIVSWIWFFGLALVGRISGQLDKSGRMILVLNKVSAIIMWGTAVYLAVGII